MKIGNRVTEKDIRDWLDSNRYVGATASITDLELHAIQRPGWVQVFSFEVKVTSANEFEVDDIRRQKFGVVLDDERNRKLEDRTKIWIFESENERDRKLEEVSKDMIIRNSKTDSLPLIWIFVTAILFLVVFALINWLGR